MRHSVGTESRLLTVFELLRQMTQGSELNPDARVAELERRKAEIDAQIQRIRDGQGLLLDPTQVKERFLQMAATARSILSDFRDVDQNFRDLDRTVRERIATSEDARGVLLDGIFSDRDAIENSDQGRSFRAFWDFLMSTERQEELCVAQCRDGTGTGAVTFPRSPSSANPLRLAGGRRGGATHGRTTVATTSALPR